MLGIPESTVRNWWNAGVCATCGAPTEVSNGQARMAKHCSPCAHVFEHENKRWTRAAVIEAFRLFATITGRTPSTVDVFLRQNVARNARLSADRRDEVPREVLALLPPHATVRGEFTTWGAAVAAAGLPQPPRGRRAHRIICKPDAVTSEAVPSHKGTGR